MVSEAQKLTVFISTPLEREYVERIRNVDRNRLEVICDPELWPPTRYIADHKGPEDFRRPSELDERWKQGLGRADILFDFPPKSPDGAGGMDYAPHVKWVQTTSSGVGKLVKDLGFQDSELLVTTAGGVHTQALAEFVFMGILTHVKQLSLLKEEQEKHHWQRYCGEGLEGKTLAILGMGRVGRQIAKMGQAFDMRVIGTDLLYGEEDAAKLGLDMFYPLNRLHDMLQEADTLVIIVPDTPETRNMIDKKALASFKEGVILINIGRGQVIDEEGMIEALRSGKIGSAVLDVFQTEPLPSDNPLWDMPNVLISPHSASTVTTENRKISDIFCYNLQCYLDGRISDMKNILDKKRMF
ncbi:D-2-hydroxyacid dehydrogenase [Planctomycetota bacterium]